MAGIQGKKAAGATSLTANLDEAMREHLQTDAAFRKAYLGEAVRLMITGDIETGKHALRRYINATIGFIRLSEAVGRSSKTLMQMLSPKGNPQIRNFFEIVAYLQKVEGAEFAVVEKGRSDGAAKTAA